MELFIRSITSKPLLKCLLQFIVLHEHEGVPIIETLTQRLGNFIQRNKIKSDTPQKAKSLLIGELESAILYIFEMQ